MAAHGRYPELANMPITTWPELEGLAEVAGAAAGALARATLAADPIFFAELSTSERLAFVELVEMLAYASSILDAIERLPSDRHDLFMVGRILERTVVRGARSECGTLISTPLLWCYRLIGGFGDVLSVEMLPANPIEAFTALAKGLSTEPDSAAVVRAVGRLHGIACQLLSVVVLTLSSS